MIRTRERKTNRTGQRAFQWAGLTALSRRIKLVMPWMLVLAISNGVAFALNSAVVRALSPSLHPVDDLSPTVDPCAMDVDGVLYAGWELWLPRGRSQYCRLGIDPGGAQRRRHRDAGDR
jgi:hypothetical protein